jgi:hypothetical protein
LETNNEFIGQQRRLRLMPELWYQPQIVPEAQVESQVREAEPDRSQRCQNRIRVIADLRG